MKKLLWEFFRRGLGACGFGPLVLAVIYWILQYRGNVQTLTVNQVCLGIVSLSVLAFIAGGMNAIYQIERLPLMVASLIHGGVLYISYLAVYLINGWLQSGITPILVFTVVFVVGYLAIWAVIHSIIKKKTARLNAMLKRKQQNEEGVSG